jgi:hypothetical protein
MIGKGWSTEVMVGYVLPVQNPWPLFKVFPELYFSRPGKPGLLCRRVSIYRLL